MKWLTTAGRRNSANMATYLASHLVARPTGYPDESCFELRELPLPDLCDGEVLVRNSWMSVEPSMRGRIGADLGYERSELNRPVSSRAVGRVLESRAPGFEPGDVVLHSLGWRDKAIVPAPQI